MDVLFYYTGKLVWVGIACLLAWLVIEVVIGFVNAVSWSRWVYRSARKHGQTLRWLGFPQSFLYQWFDFVGYRNRGSVTYSRRDGGVWRGIGDWSVGLGPIEVAPFEPEPPTPPKA